jgi:hypothetical protein
MNLIKTEWKKIWYRKKIIHMLFMCFAVSLFCIALMIMAKSDSSVFSVMQAYYEIEETEPSIMPEGTELSPENSIGYILGLNSWNNPKGFEIHRSAMFPTFIFFIFFLIDMSTLYSEDYSLLMFRQAIFCGAGKLRVFISKFFVNHIFYGLIFLANIVGLYSFFCVYTGYIPSGKDIGILLLSLLLSIFNFAVFESMAILLVVYTKNSIVGIVVNVLWFFSSFMIYPMLHKDFWGSGKVMGIFVTLSPGTYLYQICSSLVTKEVVLNNLIYATFMLIGLWAVILLKLRKQEI